jgi:hypothetical protein
MVRPLQPWRSGSFHAASAIESGLEAVASDSTA